MPRAAAIDTARNERLDRRQSWSGESLLQGPEVVKIRGQEPMLLV